jgi:hypothetical protein
VLFSVRVLARLSFYQFLQDYGEISITLSIGEPSGISIFYLALFTLQVTRTDLVFAYETIQFYTKMFLLTATSAAFVMKRKYFVQPTVRA